MVVVEVVAAVLVVVVVVVEVVVYKISPRALGYAACPKKKNCRKCKFP